MSAMRKVLLVALLVGLAVGGAWAWYQFSGRFTSIGRIQEAPREYTGREVTIKGKAGEGFTVLGHGGFEVDDGTGAIQVVTTRGAPPAGKQVVVTGVVQDLMTIGTASAVAIFESVEDG